MKLLKKLLVRAGVVAGAVGGSVSAFAQTAPTFDTSTAVAAINAGVTPAGEIGVAGLALVAVIGIWMKLRRPAR